MSRVTLSLAGQPWARPKLHKIGETKMLQSTWLPHEAAAASRAFALSAHPPSMGFPEPLKMRPSMSRDTGVFSTWCKVWCGDGRGGQDGSHGAARGTQVASELSRSDVSTDCTYYNHPRRWPSKTRPPRLCRKLRRSHTSATTCTRACKHVPAAWARGSALCAPAHAHLAGELQGGLPVVDA